MGAVGVVSERFCYYASVGKFFVQMVLLHETGMLSCALRSSSLVSYWGHGKAALSLRSLFTLAARNFMVGLKEFNCLLIVCGSLSAAPRGCCFAFAPSSLICPHHIGVVSFRQSLEPVGGGRSERVVSTR